MTRKDIDKIENFDFGFSFTDDAEAKVEDLTSNLHSKNSELEDYQNRLDKLYNAIIPFLDNLCRDPEKATIHWPNRVEKIQDYKVKLQQIIEGK